MNKCNRCKKEKDSKEFITSKGKPSTRCIKCREDRNRQATKFYHDWHDEKIEQGRKYYHENRERYKFIRRRAALKRKYNITPEDYDLMIKNQKGKCGICGIILKEHNQKGWGGKNAPCVDHSHETGKVRGILCRGCNLALSMIENKTFLLQANQYLSKLEK